MVGLRELLLRAHEFTDLAVQVPPAEVGMLRVLYTVAARVSGLDKVTEREPDPERQWRARRDRVLLRGRFTESEVDAYLNRFEGRWDLFDPVWPWWQDPRLRREAVQKSANVLDPTRPGDNTPIWWKHTHAGYAPPIPTAQALQWLLVHHYYGSGGTGGSRRVEGTVSQHMSSGPLRAALVFSPLAPTLFRTLIAGLPEPGTVEDPYGPDAAPWEVDELHDPLATPPPASWPAGLLTGRSRHALLLVPDSRHETVVGCYLTWGWKPRHVPHADPYTIRDRDAKGEWRVRQANASRALWRDVDALLGTGADAARPDILTAALHLPAAERDSLRVRVHGFDQDTKTVNRTWFTALTPPLLAAMVENDPERAHGAEAMHQAAEKIAAVMFSALRAAYSGLGTETGSRDGKRREVPWVAPAAEFYWPAAEDLFWEAIRTGSFDEPYRRYARLAVDAVAEATRHVAHHPHVTREITVVERSLFGFAAKKNPRPEALNEANHEANHEALLGASHAQ